MTPLAKNVQRIYLFLTFGNVLAASFIWGINTLFLLDAGLSNFQAFAANAFFTAGMVIFEIPTGIVADTWGRRVSYLLGTITLAVTTFLYYILWQIHAPFWEWAVVSVLLGLGFTFFSGAVEAWLVDALKFAKYKGNLENVFGKAQIVGGVAMLGGSVAGGFVAQISDLGVPYVIRTVVLAMLFIAAFILMRDWGFTPAKRDKPLKAMKGVFNASVEHGLGNPPVRWMMLAAPFTVSVGFYVFYALQPYLLELYGDTGAYGIAGLAAALVAGAQIVGGVIAPRLRSVFKRRTSALMAATVVTSAVLLGLGLVDDFWSAILLVSIWGLLFAAVTPIRQAYLNGMIPSQQRATVLSFDSLMGNVGGIFVQPALGRVADVYSYGTSFVIGAGIQLVSVPFVWASRRLGNSADKANADS